VDIQRINREVVRALAAFAFVEVHPNGQGGVLVKAALQTSAQRTYVVSITLTNYPHQMPHVYVTTPAIDSSAPHRYRDGNLCYLHPTMWNPGVHDLVFVIARIAKWLNKYEVWREQGRWPGAQLAH